MSTHGTLLLLACLSLSALAGCGGQQAAAPAPAPGPRAPSAAPAKQAAPAGQLARADVDRVLLLGPPWLLRRVPVEEVIRAGAFIGWKVLALPQDWTGIELKPGDVVTQINGTPLERPDELFAAYRKLASATELKITYEREGTARELVVPIFGSPSPEVVKTFESDSPPRRPTAARPRGTTVIEEEDTSTPLDSNEL
ncbi:serine protease [Sorangium cellulosum]|uniref:Serine protease n=1 Tax=Sorangium cellulosum TaxID=56 RepID=A0A2L0EP80_SORCE|nr:PDZ domain-containing protein [Sorangium cellulosum]AUX41117.1 serine protease [Sorangium cellulosum]